MDENMNTTEAQVQESAVPDAEAVAAEENAAASKPETSVENETGANEAEPANSRNLRKKTAKVCRHAPPAGGTAAGRTDFPRTRRRRGQPEYRKAV